jgi:hypothetical protein
MKKSALAYYITAHGYGHGVRSCDVLRAFHQACPEVPLVLVTDLPAPFLKNRLPDIPFTLRSAVFDVGMVQLDSVRVNVEDTLTQALALAAQRDRLLQREKDFLQMADIGLVACDIPAIPLAAAAQSGVPGVALGNFSWSWIYSAFVERDARWQEVIDLFEQDYRQADLLLRFPFAEEMHVFPRRQDVPVVAAPGTNRRTELAELTGASPDRRWLLLSFSSLEWDEAALDAVAELKDYAFFTVLPLGWDRENIFPVDRDRVSFPDVLASVDAVITKPGFGVVSECVVNRKPMMYVDRSDFLEYPVLEAAVKKYLVHQHIPAEALYRGQLSAYLESLWSQPPPLTMCPCDGAPIVARHLAHLLAQGKTTHSK